MVELCPVLLQLANFCLVCVALLLPGGYELRVVAAVSYCALTALCLFTALRDPGAYQAPPSLCNASLLFGEVDISPLTRFSCRECGSCGLQRPPLTKHAAGRNRCILLFDHDCAYLGADVGLRNYLPFLFTLRAALVFYGIALLRCAFGLFCALNDRPDKDELPVAALTAGLFGGYYAATGVYFALNMVGYHRFLIKEDQTTSGYLGDRGAVLSSFQLALLRADEFLDEISPVPVLAARCFRHVPRRYERAVIGFCAPVFQKMDPRTAQAEAWRWTIHASGLYNHLPESVLAVQ